MANEEDLDLRPEALKARSLLSLHQQARELHPEKGETKSTIVFEHGMNPGLLSHLVKHGLAQISREILTQKEIPELASAYSSSDFARMAYYLGLEVVHCSEKDTQIPLIPRKPGEFLNTWGAYSLYGEGVDPVQIGLGTHEPLFTEEGTLFENQLILPSRGAFTYGHSYVPLVGKIHGMIIPHGENDSVNRALTLRNEKMLIYRPSNYYVYSPAKMAWDSLEEVRQNNYKFLPSPQSLRGYQLLDGMDAVGALLIFRSDPRQKLLHDRETEPASYWVGSILSLAQTRAMGFRYAGPTTLQVAISVVTAVRWILENPGRGICFPEDLPYAEILDACIPYLGTFWSDWVDYRPESTEWRYFLGRDRLQKAVRL